jgi:D-alanyl-D-alanine carboxypeptidase (penicillin-binding protein 5/6)
MLLLLLALAAPSPSAAQPGFRPDRFAAIAVEAKTGEVLFSRKADAARHPASLTKVMTLYLAFEEIEQGRLKLDERIRVSRHAAAQPPTKAGLRAGSTLTVREAIDLIAVKSANDAAAALAEHIAGSEARFARRMNREARKLGMRRTRFTNASGLPDPAMTTTARDLSVLARAFLEHHPDAYKVFAKRRVKFRGRSIRGHNRLLATPGVDGIKTGYTRASGFNLMTSGVEDGRRVVAVVLGGDTARVRDRYMRDLLKKTFARLPEKARNPTRIARAEAKAQPASSRQDDEAEGGGLWWVQVGAFTSSAQAWRRLEEIAGRFPQRFGEAPRGVDHPGGLHQARFNVFSEEAAREGCELLKSQGQPCFWFGGPSPAPQRNQPTIAATPASPPA